MYTTMTPQRTDRDAMLAGVSKIAAAGPNQRRAKILAAISLDDLPAGVAEVLRHELPHGADQSTRDQMAAALTEAEKIIAWRISRAAAEEDWRARQAARRETQQSQPPRPEPALPTYSVALLAPDRAYQHTAVPVINGTPTESDGVVRTLTAEDLRPGQYVVGSDGKLIIGRMTNPEAIAASAAALAAKKYPLSGGSSRPAKAGKQGASEDQTNGKNGRRTKKRA